VRASSPNSGRGSPVHALGATTPPAQLWVPSHLAGPRGVGLEIVIEVDDVDRAYALASLEAERHRGRIEPLCHRPWNTRDFRLVDPDGYLPAGDLRQGIATRSVDPVPVTGALCAGAVNVAPYVFPNRNHDVLICPGCIDAWRRLSLVERAVTRGCPCGPRGRPCLGSSSAKHEGHLADSTFFCGGSETGVAGGAGPGARLGPPGRPTRSRRCPSV
jgi:hypothetical protein